MQGLLTNQIAYADRSSVKAIFRADSRDLLAPVCHATVTAEGASGGREHPWAYWGQLWGEHWWVLEVDPLSVGRYRIETRDTRGMNWFQTIEVRRRPYWKLSIQHVALGQFERRAMIPTVPGQGWLDCGAHLSEANSHAVALYGMCQLWQNRRADMEPTEQERLLQQIRYGSRYFLFLAEEAQKHGMPRGTYVHEPVHAHVWLLADSLEIGVALCQALTVLTESDPPPTDLISQLQTNLRENLCFLAKNRVDVVEQMLAGLPPSPPDGGVQLRVFSRHTHAWDEDTPPPNAWSTRELLLLLQLLLSADSILGMDSTDEILRVADEIMERWVETDPHRAPGTPSCYFIPFPGIDQPEVAWCHHSVGRDTGGVFPHFVMPLWELAERYPNHPQARRWRGRVEQFVDGYLQPAFSASPFGLLPNTWKREQGWLFFAGLWHGMNASYALLAMQAFILARKLDRPWLNEMGRAQLDWIAGLNVGLTQDSQMGCLMTNRDIPNGIAQPVSMIFGEGQDWAGSWRTIRGSICNGFSRGRQFFFDVEPTLAEDRPDGFTDEDWITHGGAWLAALAHTDL